MKDTVFNLTVIFTLILMTFVPLQAAPVARAGAVNGRR